MAIIEHSPGLVRIGPPQAMRLQPEQVIQELSAAGFTLVKSYDFFAPRVFPHFWVDRSKMTIISVSVRRLQPGSLQRPQRQRLCQLIFDPMCRRPLLPGRPTRTKPLGDLAARTEPLGDLAARTEPLGDLAARTATLGDLATRTDTLGDLATRTETLGDLATRTDTLDDLATRTETLGNLATRTETLGNLATRTDTLDDLVTRPEPLGDLATRTENLGDLATRTETRNDLTTPTAPLDDTLPTSAPESPVPTPPLDTLPADTTDTPLETAVAPSTPALTTDPLPTLPPPSNPFLSFASAQPPRSPMSEQNPTDINCFLSFLGLQRAATQLLLHPEPNLPDVTEQTHLYNAPLLWERRPASFRIATSTAPLPLAAIAPFTWLSNQSHLGSLAHALHHLQPSANLIFFEATNEFSPLLRTAFPDARIELGPGRLLQQPSPLECDLTIDGYDATYCGPPNLPDQLHWLTEQHTILTNLESTHNLSHFLLFIRHDFDPDTFDPRPLPAPHPTFDAAIRRLFTTDQPTWQITAFITTLSLFDDSISQMVWVCLGLQIPDTGALSDSTLTTIHSEGTDFVPFGPHIDTNLNTLPNAIDFNSYSIFPNLTPFQDSSSLESYADRYASPSPVTHSPTPVHPVLNPNRPGTLPNRYDTASTFGGYFGIQFTSDHTRRLGLRAASPSEILSMLHFSPDFIRLATQNLPHESLTTGLHSCLGIGLQSTLLRFTLDLPFRSHPTPDTPTAPPSRPDLPPRQGPLPCLVSQLPSPDDWSQAYEADPGTALMWSTYSNEDTSHSWTKKELNTIDPVYRDILRRDGIFRRGHRLLYNSTIKSGDRYLLLIVVPASLQRLVFTAFHATPCAGHMGRHATLIRLRLRFFWPRMASYVARAIRQCPDCILSNSTNRPSTSLLHGSVPDEPWRYIHTDAWSPGDTVSFTGDAGTINSMDDLSSAVIVTTIKEFTAAHFARRFLENVLLRVGVTGVVVVDADSKFRDLFQQMCAALKIRWISVARGNHKGLRVERFHRFLNKVVTNECRHRGTNQVFPETCHVAAYAWNSAPTEDSDITRSFVAFGLNFRFPMDIDLEKLPKLIGPDSATAVHRYLHGIAQQRETSRFIVKCLNDDRRAAHRERVNATRRPISFQVGDFVTVRVQHQSQASTNRVKKLEWDAKGPFEITKVHGHDSYEVRPYQRPDLAPRTYKTDQLRQLPPSIQPCSPLDTIDHRYLNIDRAPILHPYRASLGISSYNHLWLDEKPPIHPDDTSTTEPLAVSATNPHFPPIHLLSDHSTDDHADADTDVTMTDADSPLTPEDVFMTDATSDTATNLNQTSETAEQPTRPTTASPPATPQPTIPASPSVTPNSDLLSGPALYDAILKSHDRLFFIRYRSAGTTSPSLQLVQVNLDASSRCAETLSHLHDTIYYADFLTRPLADLSKPFDQSRWRLIWHEYTVDTNGAIVYSSKRREFPPNKVPDPNKYITWCDFPRLDDPDIYLLGPFDFTEPGLTPTGLPKSREHIPPAVWHRLLAILNNDNTLPIPDLSFLRPSEDSTNHPRSKRSRLHR